MKLASKQILLAANAILSITLARVFFISIRQSKRVRGSTESVHHTEQIFQHIQKVILSALNNEIGARVSVIIVNDKSQELPRIFKRKLYGSHFRLKKVLAEKFLFIEMSVSRLNFSYNNLPDNTIIA